MSEEAAVSISGVGLCSSLTGVVEAAAAFRSGLAWPQEYAGFPSFDPQDAEPYELIAHPAAGIAAGFQGPARLIRMSQEALNDLQNQVAVDDLNPDKTACYLISTTSEQGLTSEHPLVERLWTRLVRGRKPRHRQVNLEGAAGLHTVLQQISPLLRDGVLDACLIGVTDSLCRQDVLRRLALEGRLKGIEQPVGLMPGEAACFVLLERLSSARRAGRMPLAILKYAGLHRVNSSSEEVPETVQAGYALARTILQALTLGGVTAETPGTLYSDLNGEVGPATAMGYAMAGLPGDCPVRTWPHLMPATSFGDTGAAAPLVALCMAVRAFVRGYHRGPYALLVHTQGANVIGSMLLEQDVISFN